MKDTRYKLKQIRVEESDLELLDKLGKEEERSVTYLIRAAIKEYLANRS